MELIVIPLALLTAVATFTGGLIALRLHHSIPTVIALTGGIVVAVAIFDLLPEAVEHVGDAHEVATLVGAGFLGFFLIERSLVLHHRDSEEEAKAHNRVGALGAFGVAGHSFVDGLGIGLAFGLDSQTGFFVFLAVISHNFADGLNTVSFVLSQSGDRTRAIRWLAIVAAAPVLGALIGNGVSVSEETLGALLAVYAGFFLCMGATDLLPEAHSHASWKRVLLTVSGFVLIYAVSSVAHG